MPRLSSALFATLLVACNQDLPGEAVGTYRVVMNQSENTCGQRGLLPPDGYEYAVELREEAPRGYWHLPRAAPISGTYAAGEFSFTLTRTFDLGDVDAGTSGCIVLQEERLTGQIEFAGDAGTRTSDGGTRATDAGSLLHGEHRIGFRADPNGRCANVQGPIGVYDKLPCNALYRLEGVERKPL